MAVINFTSSVLSLPLATRTLSLLVLLFSLTLFLLRIFRTEESVHFITFSKSDSAIAFPWLVIVPGVSFWYPWTLITAGLCETSFIEFLVTIITLPLAGRYLERIWGAVEFARFTLIVVVGSNIIAWVVAIALYIVLGSETAFYGTQYHGLEALQVAFLVALTQLIPDHQVYLLGGKLPPMRVRDLPMLYVTFSNITCILGYTSPFILIQFGWLISWIYLRFYRYNPENGTRGDRSETFAFVLWFPPFVHKPLGIVTSFAHSVFVRLRVIPKYHYEYVPGDLEFEGGAEGGQTGTTARAEAERRRAMALKALDQRMAVRSSNGNTTTSANVNGGPSSSVSQPAVVPPPQTRPSAPPPPPELVFQAPEDDEAPRPAPSLGSSHVPALSKKQQEEEPEWPSSGEEEDGDIGAGAATKGQKGDKGGN